jgi:hypothetical protein
MWITACPEWLSVEGCNQVCAVGSVPAVTAGTDHSGHAVLYIYPQYTT